MVHRKNSGSIRPAPDSGNVAVRWSTNHRNQMLSFWHRGTIAGGTQAAYTSGAVTIDAMIAAVPGIKDRADIKGE